MNKINALIICDQNHLIRQLDEKRQEGKKIVFTNGCFDIIHSGHVAYLEKARSYGDLLVVALNDDSSVKRLKGKERPVFTLNDRAAVIAALRCVDIVTSFSEDTPLALIAIINPDVLVKGGDYSLETIVGANEVLNNGGEVKIVPYIHGKSTSALIEKIKKI